jgi:DNA-binding NarL/FixJ family response regulator
MPGGAYVETAPRVPAAFPDRLAAHMTTILLADSRPVVRRGIAAWLQDEAGMHVVGEAANGLEACDLAERLQPEVAILDTALPLLNGLEATRQIRARSPHTRVVIFSACPQEPHVAQALSAGAVAFVPQEAPSAELLCAIQEAARGRRYLPERFMDLAMDAYAAQGQSQSGALERLTDRERQILYLVVEGRTSAEIAELLFLSKRTVEAHRARMMRKLELHTMLDLLRFALRHGILPPET